MLHSDNSITETQENLLRSMFKLVRSLLDESERASVILAAAHLDSDLETLLKHLLIPHPGGTDPMFEGDRMLGTFSAKISIALRLGAISNDYEHALQLVRRIRNDFAHQLDHESLASPKQKARLDALVRYFTTSNVFIEGCRAFEKSAKSQSHLHFVVATVCLSLPLRVGLQTLTRVRVGEPLDL